MIRNLNLKLTFILNHIRGHRLTCLPINLTINIVPSVNRVINIEPKRTVHHCISNTSDIFGWGPMNDDSLNLHV